MLVHTLRTLMLLVVTAPPFFLLLTGCTFGAPGQAAAVEATAGIFCNIETGRACAMTQEDIDMGINLAKQDEQGFWIQKSGKHGLDYSAAAVAKCAGMPEKVFFKGPIPEGSPFCVGPTQFPTVTAACQAKCDDPQSLDENGEPYRCDHVAWPAHRADMIFPNACSAAGTPLTSFQDPRLLPPFKAVVWRDLTNVLQLPGTNTLRKMSATPIYDAGANATTLLSIKVNGAVEFTATETNKERTAGFSEGEMLPDNDISDLDIKYAVVLQNNGTLLVTESGSVKYTGTYAANDTIRVQVMGGVVSYLKNKKLLFAGAIVNPNVSVLRFSVSLKDFDATITNAQSTF